MRPSAPVSGLEPHHDGSGLYVRPVVPRLGDGVTLRLRAPVPDSPRAVGLRAVLDAEPRMLRASFDGVADGVEWWSVVLPLINPAVHYRWLIVDGASHRWVTADGVTDEEPRDSDDFVIAADTDAPDWLEHAVIYQVFPDRFARSAEAALRPSPSWAHVADWDEPVAHGGASTAVQLFGGDLDGIRDHLDHLDRLGVTTLYLTPFFPSRSNHRYDATSFTSVDPLLGGDDALVRLTEAAHSRGIRVLGDLTTNHAGNGHEWFRAAHGRPDAPESEYFIWLDGANQEYVSWLGHTTLPKLDWSSGALRRRFIDGPDSVVARWLEPPYSLDGWRIDVANMTGRQGPNDLNEDVRRTLRRTMRGVDPQTLLLAEHTADAAADFQGDAWHGAMTYSSFTRPLWAWLMDHDKPVYAPQISTMPFPTIGGETFVAENRRFSAAYPWTVRLGNLNALDSHDTPRFAGSAAAGTVPVAFGLSVALPGTPFIWAGDELGLTADDGEQSRTPMPWQRMDEFDDLIERYAELIAVRRESPALRRGGLRWLHASDDAVVFIRELESDSALVFASRAAAVADVRLDAPQLARLLAHPRPIVGDAVVERDGDHVALTSRGADFCVWRLLGVSPPTDAH